MWYTQYLPSLIRHRREPRQVPARQTPWRNYRNKHGAPDLCRSGATAALDGREDTGLLVKAWAPEPQPPPTRDERGLLPERNVFGDTPGVRGPSVRDR